MSLRGARDLITFGRRAATSWHAAVLLIPLVLLGELVLCLLIIKVIRYTPIDFKAYMEEVEGPLVHGVYNYSLLRGETGPLVYPGGFVYLYGALRWLAHDGTDVLPAQLAMAACYVATLGAAIACHAIARPRGLPPWALLLVSTSLRLHSIYVLRLFNDGWAMLGFWLAVLAFLRGHWKLGCALYSLGVSVKANVLLSAPGLLLLLLQAKGLAGALGHIALCAAVQLGLGWPFLRADFFAYLRGALGGFGDLQQKWCPAAAAPRLHAHDCTRTACACACACAPLRMCSACTPRVHTACSLHLRARACAACARHARAALAQEQNPCGDDLPSLLWPAYSGAAFKSACAVASAPAPAAAPKTQSHVGLDAARKSRCFIKNVPVPRVPAVSSTVGRARRPSSTVRFEFRMLPLRLPL